MASAKSDKDKTAIAKSESITDAGSNKQADVTPEMLIKHPLQNRWSLWFFKNQKGRDWKLNLKRITSFDTVEDFWALYNHTQRASKLLPGCDYSVFKEGIEPMWEDARNREGGRWLMHLSKQQRHNDLDKIWLETLLCLIGEAFDADGDYVCGAVVNIRPTGDKLSLWTSDIMKSDENLKIGKKLKQRLNIPEKINIAYEAHADTQQKRGSTTKHMFTV